MTIPHHTLDFTLLECMWTLRWLRALRDQKRDEMMQIEERLKALRPGKEAQDLVNLHRALDADVAIADEIIRKIWATCGPAPAPHGPPPSPGSTTP